jgi:hypothetical protein
MKKTKIIYWISTILVVLSLGATAIPDVLAVPDAVKFMTQLGYPHYFIPFIGVAKVLGVIAIVIPGFPRIKEWAYAGLFFDLIGATYSQLATTPSSMVALMVIWFIPLIVSYIYHHKRLNENI